MKIEKTIKNLFSWFKQKLLSLKLTEKDTKTTCTIGLEEGKHSQTLNIPSKNNQNKSMIHTQYTNTDCPQQSTEICRYNSNIENDNKHNLKFIGHNINELRQDNFKLNLLVEYCSNNGADIIGICETNRNRKQGEFWNKDNLEYTSFWTNKANKKKGSEVCIIINKKWEKHIGKINRIGDFNSYMDKTLDYSSPSKLEKRPLNIITCYIETYGQNEDMLNKLWDIICSCTQQAALKHIPHKKIGGNKTNINRNYKEMEDFSKERKDLLYIRSIMRKLHKNELKGKELLNATKGIKTFN
ncbi:hypothetical protein RCL_jg12546.t1 [Rhizophagus clarus]|uniref:Uncharacterized protein n=1 Tax=Rhizophagus clarus TaxID=94130 RepID=A0A8H3LQU4_9GLOM|nr:hypothetical protein RCL_jg12546.t1 [Rhizophagus clarus]